MKRRAIPLLPLGTGTARDGETFTFTKKINKIWLLILGDEFEVLVVFLYKFSNNETTERPAYVILQLQGDQKVSVHLIITAQQIRKNILNSSNHLPW
jgi:hypothetical protein